MKLLGFLLASSLVVTSAGCPNEARNESITASNEGAKAYGQKQYDTAIEAYKRATQRWSDNHLAWYGLGGAYANKGD